MDKAVKELQVEIFSSYPGIEFDVKMINQEFEGRNIEGFNITCSFPKRKGTTYVPHRFTRDDQYLFETIQENIANICSDFLKPKEFYFDCGRSDDTYVTIQIMSYEDAKAYHHIK
jgi:hypothetical protein